MHQLPAVRESVRRTPARALQRVVVTLLVSLASAVPAAADDAAAAADPAVEQLKQTALDLNVELDRLEENLTCPEQQRVNIYVDTQIESIAIVDVYLRFDDQLPLRKTFDQTEAASLAHGGLYRLSCVNTQAGTHRLRAEYRVRDLAAPADTPPTLLVYDDAFEQGPQTSDLEIAVDRNSFLSAPELRLRILRPSQKPHAHSLLYLFGFTDRDDDPGRGEGVFRLGGADDPQLRNAQFLADIGRRFSALTRLLRLRSDHPERALAPDYDQQSAAIEIEFGTLQAAAAAYRKALAAGAKKADLVEVRLQLALAFYRRGDFASAAYELGKLRPSVSRQQLLQWQDLQSRVLLAQGRFAEASTVLLHAENKADYESYVRYYDLGVALLQTDHGGQGATVLDRVGRIYTDSPLLQALRDQANLTLGYYFLRQQQGATAIPILNRIASEGPHANRALLGLGWAWLSPPGSKQKRVQLGDERTVGPPPEAVIGRLPSISDHNLYQRYHVRPFQRAHISEDESTRLKRALVAWAEFDGRDTSDPAVQEGFLAIALALDKLGAHQGARDYYERGVTALDATGHQLEAALSFAAGDRWMDALLQNQPDVEPGSDWVLQNLPNPSVAVFLHDVIAGDRFQQAMQDYRDLRLLRNTLQAAPARLSAVTLGDAATAGAAQSLRARSAALLPQIAAAEDVQRARVRRVALDDLEAQMRENRKLSKAAHYALAGVYDRPSASSEEP